jgi:hypothetical protein
MTINQALTSLVLANTAITNVIGQRFTPAIALDGKILPAATYQRISANHIESFGGSSGLCFARYQVNTLATTAAVAKQLGKLIRVCLHGYVGTVSGLEIQGITWEGDGDLLDASADLESARVYGFRNDFLIHYAEAVPA